jgi:hypothetical protein
MKTRYRKVKGFPGYLVSNKGRVWSNRQGRWKRLRTPPNNQGYPVVVLHTKDGHPKMFCVHVLVLTVYRGPAPPGKEGCHFPDRTKTNCRLDNLRWDTRKNNLKDREYHGTKPQGETHGMAILSDADVLQMRTEYKGRANPPFRVFCKYLIQPSFGARPSILLDYYPSQVSLTRNSGNGHTTHPYTSYRLLPSQLYTSYTPKSNPDCVSIPDLSPVMVLSPIRHFSPSPSQIQPSF